MLTGYLVDLLQVVATVGTYDIAMELGKKVLCQRCPPYNLNLSSCFFLLEIIFLNVKYVFFFGEIMKLINGPCQKFCL